MQHKYLRIVEKRGNMLLHDLDGNLIQPFEAQQLAAAIGQAAQGKTYVYFGLREADGLYKIGWSANPSQQRWRAFNLVVKAKLEAIESGISTLEDEFMAFIQLPSGETVGQWMQPQIEAAYRTGTMPPLLPMPKTEAVEGMVVE